MAVSDPSGLIAALNATSIAIVGASGTEARIGGRPVAATLRAGFSGKVYPVNPRYKEVFGIPCYPDLASLPGKADLVVSAVGHEATLQVIRDAPKVGAGTVVVFASGYREVGEEGKRLELELSTTAAEAGIELIGPNCLGILSTATGMMASFTATLESGPVLPGSAGFVCQSGAFGSYFLAMARQRHLGVRYWAATGNEASVTVADWIEAYLEDPEVSVIAGYLEGVSDPDQLLGALGRAADAGKPVVLLKTGRSSAGARAALSHTGAMVGDDRLFDAVLSGYGAYRARDLEELLDMVEAIGYRRLPVHNRDAILTVSGGVGILMADRAEEVGLSLDPPPPELAAKLRSLVPYSGLVNPIDFTGQFLSDASIAGRFFSEIEASGFYGSAIVFLGHTSLAESLALPAVEAIAGVARTSEMATFVVGLATDPVALVLRGAGIMLMANPVRSVEVVAALRSLARPFPAPEEVKQRAIAVSGVVAEAGALGVLSALGVKVPRFLVVASQEAAASAASCFDSTVVIKASRSDLLHKSDSGAVVIGVPPERCGSELVSMRERLGDPELAVVVAERVGGELELIVGGLQTEFGPVVIVGPGGVLAEVADGRVEMLVSRYSRALLLEELAKQGFGRAVLPGGRLHSPAALEDLIALVEAVAGIVLGGASEFEVNPAIWSVSEGRLVAVDALGRIG